jgi:regulator of protease activity HflC (stomatin/prohibitin superfamily)
VGSEYQLAPRALILRRGHAAVQSVSQLKTLLRSNGYNATAVAAAAKDAAHAATAATADDADDDDGGGGSSAIVGGLLRNREMRGRADDRGDPFAASPWSAVRARGVGVPL